MAKNYKAYTFLFLFPVTTSLSLLNLYDLSSSASECSRYNVNQYTSSITSCFSSAKIPSFSHSSNKSLFLFPISQAAKSRKIFLPVLAAIFLLGIGDYRWFRNDETWRRVRMEEVEEAMGQIAHRCFYFRSARYFFPLPSKFLYHPQKKKKNIYFQKYRKSKAPAPHSKDRYRFPDNNPSHPVPG